MGWKGEFSRIMSHKAAGSPVYSFTLKNTNLFSSETIDLVLSDGYGQKPWYFRKQKIKAGESMYLNLDTVGWEWCNGDFCAILDKNNNIKQKWALNLKRYSPGECPSCHGSHKCSYCRGDGYMLNKKTVEITRCAYCGGSGICMTCYIPERKPPLVSPVPYPTQAVSTTQSRSVSPAKINEIQTRIGQLQQQINQLDWNMKMMELDGSQIRNHTAYQSYMHLKYSYQTQLIQLQQQLQNML